MPVSCLSPSTSISAIPPAFSSCFGSGFIDLNLIQTHWKTNQCTNQLLLSNDLKAVDESMNALMGTYYSTTPPSSPPSIVEGIILDVCSTIEGGCDTFLKRVCTQCTDSITSVPSALRLCGCYTTNLYSSITPPGCSPFCDQPGYVAQNPLKKCQTQEICIISDISAKIQYARTGTTSISQRCQGCSPGGCRCIISSSSQDIQEQCGPGSTCIKEDPSTGSVLETSCSKLTFPLPSIPLVALALLFVVTVLVLAKR